MSKAQELDVSTIELSKLEKKILKKILNNGMIPDAPLSNEEEPYAYLYRIHLIERCYSDKYPYSDRGELSTPLNAIRITDKGRIALRRSQSSSLHWKWQIVCDIVMLLISLAAFIKSFFF